APHAAQHRRRGPRVDPARRRARARPRRPVRRVRQVAAVAHRHADRRRPGPRRAGPRRGASVSDRPGDEIPAPLQEQRAFLLRSLEDLEREYAAGDVDEVDYRSLKDDYTARAAAVIRAIEAGRAAAAEPAPPPAPRRRLVVVVAAVVAF